MGFTLSVNPKSSLNVDVYRTKSNIQDITVQELADNARLIVELADGTTYSLKLNDCVDGSSDPVAEWESGQRYTYTISVKKEEIKFRALINDWVANTGSGNATLDWD